MNCAFADPELTGGSAHRSVIFNNEFPKANERINVDRTALCFCNALDVLAYLHVGGGSHLR